MPLAPLPKNEEERLAALIELKLLDTEPEEAFDAFTRLATQMLDAPMATISLIDAERQWVKSCIGIADTETPRDVAFCAYTILQGGALAVSDATNDARFAQNPHVLGDPNVRAYLGVPLRTAAGWAIGSLCVIDTRPRSFDGRQIQMLTELAHIVEREIRHRERVALTQRLASDSWQSAAQSAHLYRATFDHAALGIAILGLDGRFQRVNNCLCEILGRAQEGLAGIGFHDVTHPDDLELSQATRHDLLQGKKESGTLRKRLCRPDGSFVWTEIKHTLVRDEAQQPSHIVSLVEDITARLAAEQALRSLRLELEDRVEERTAELLQARERLEDLYENAPCGYYSLDEQGRFVQLNATSARLFGMPREKLLGRSPRDFFTAEGVKRFGEVYPRFIRDGHFGPEEFDLLSGDGEKRRVSVMATALRDERGTYIRSRTVIYDVTELHRVRETLQTMNSQQALMLDNDLFPIARIKNRCIVWANKAFENLVGYSAEELIGRSTRMFYRSDEDHQRVGALAIQAIDHGGRYRVELELIRKDGKSVWIDMSGARLLDDSGESLWMALDITTAKLYQQRVEALAYHDALTGLPNRSLLMDRLAQGLAFAKRASHHVAVCFGDLNGFKAVNDEHGHEAGDVLLREVGRRLLHVVRTHDTVARIGGDEFVLVLTQLSAPEEQSVVLARASAAVSEPIALPSGASVCVTVSFGVAIAPIHGLDAEELIARADKCMYEAKRRDKQLLGFQITTLPHAL